MRVHRLFVISAVVILQFAAARLPAQSTGAAVPDEARQFDFWIGEWTVTSADGTVAGTNRIEMVSDGRGLLEHWSGSPARGNGTGKSLNAWNAQKKQWQQFWIGSAGVVLELSGGLDEKGRMVLRGTHLVSAETALERITWTPNADGSVRQLWEQSTNDGATWRTVFDGRYTKKGANLGASGASASRALWYLFL